MVIRARIHGLQSELRGLGSPVLRAAALHGLDQNLERADIVGLDGVFEEREWDRHTTRYAERMHATGIRSNLFFPITQLFLSCKVHVLLLLLLLFLIIIILITHLTSRTVLGNVGQAVLVPF
jgi:hypothetical protein